LVVALVVGGDMTGDDDTGSGVTTMVQLVTLVPSIKLILGWSQDGADVGQSGWSFFHSKNIKKR